MRSLENSDPVGTDTVISPVRVGDHEDNETVTGVSSACRSINFMITAGWSGELTRRPD